MKPKTARKETPDLHTLGVILNASMARTPQSPDDPDRARICLDGRNLALRDGTGVLTYAQTLAQGLPQTGRLPEVLLDAQEGGENRRNRSARWLRATWPGPYHAHEQPTPPAGFVRSLLAPDAFRLAQTHFDIHGKLLSIASRRAPPLMHWTYPLPLVFRDIPNVYTIHDLIPLRRPDLTDIAAARFARIIRRVAQQAAHIVTVSDSARHDIITLLGLPEDRVTNTYQPVARPPIPQTAPAMQGHFLFCGSIEPRKNLKRLIQAYQASNPTSPLILAGPDGWRAHECLAGADIRPLAAYTGGAGIWRAPWLPRPTLVDLLRGARALLFPSLAEGFGLPIAEAMTLRVPVLTSTDGATAEIAGNAAVLIDPLDVSAMAEAIAALDRDETLCARLAAAGIRRAALFSPAACFNRLAAVYDKLGVARQ